MSVSVDTGGKGGKKSVNADLNLVPYIDLLTCMVSFLLITAVWSQLARLEVDQRGEGTIEGGVVADASAFDDEPLGFGWSWDDLADDYAAGVSAVQWWL